MTDKFKSYREMREFRPTPFVDLLSAEYILMQAWKKVHPYIQDIRVNP